jgi:hypothetical protein
MRPASYVCSRGKPDFKVLASKSPSRVGLAIGLNRLVFTSRAQCVPEAIQYWRDVRWVGPVSLIRIDF